MTTGLFPLTPHGRQIKELQERYKYRSVGWGWCEWDDLVSTAVDDPESFFVKWVVPPPFRFRSPDHSGGPSPSIPEFYRLVFADKRDEPERVRSALEEYVAACKGWEALEDNRLVPGKLGWLIAERDALHRQLERIAARVDNEWKSPLHHLRDALKVWYIEQQRASMQVPGLIDATGPLKAGDVARSKIVPQTLATAEERLQMIERDNVAWRLLLRIWNGMPSEQLLDTNSHSIRPLFSSGVPDFVAEGTALAIAHYAGERDRIYAPAVKILPRWIAAELVLHRGLAGEPLDPGWIVSASEGRRVLSWKELELEPRRRGQHHTCNRVPAGLAFLSAQREYRGREALREVMEWYVEHVGAPISQSTLYEYRNAVQSALIPGEGEVVLKMEEMEQARKGASDLGLMSDSEFD